MKKHLNAIDGLTLIEVLIVILITVVIGVVITNVFTSTDQAYRYSFSQSQKAMAVQNVMAEIVSELKYIDSITIPNPNASSNTITFYKDGTVGRIYRDIASNSLVFEIDGGITKQLAGGLIQGINFQRSNLLANPQTITITLTVNSSVPNSQPLTASTTVALLNL